jgi:hypothetical protein
MSTIKFKRFTKPHFLKQIGRGLLGQFFTRFNTALDEKQIVLPAATLDDDAYFGAVAKIAMSPDGLPDNLVEAAYAIEGMANEEGQDRLERAVGTNGLAFQFGEDSSCADLAVQAWLANPELFAEKFNEQRLTRLASFDYFGSKLPVNRIETFAQPTAQTLGLMTADMEEAFRQKNRGRQTTHIEVHTLDGDYWFLIRHGDTSARVPTVANGQMSVLHFRPAKDDVVVYSPGRDEIRIHAGTKWEKDLYRETFGRRLFADAWYFSERKAYTLDPLRTDGVDALDVSDISGINKIVLREIEMSWPGEFNNTMVRKSLDIFSSGAEGATPAISESGLLGRAVFDFYFGDSQKPRKVHVRPPNILKLGRHCDATLVQRWLTARGFREVVANEQNCGGITHVESLAVS